MKAVFADRDKLVVTLLALFSLLWVLLSWLTWRDIANGPRVGSPWTNNGYGQSLLFESGAQAGAVVAGFVLNGAAALLGYRWVVEPVWGRSRLAATPWLVFAGVVPGTLLIAAFSRIATLILPNTVAPAFIGLALLAAVAVAGAQMLRQRGADTRLALDFRALGGALLALVAALVFSVHVDRAHGPAEGSVWFIKQIFLSEQYGIGAGGHWPIISQHYDEAAFLYPIVYGLMSTGSDASSTLSVLYWIMLAFGRLGMVCIIYVALRSLGVDRLSSLILLAFVCGASLSLNPLSSRVLFDSLSPLAYTLHIARFLASVLPVLFVASAASWNRKASRPALLVAAVLGMGLAAMPIHLALVLPWAIAVGVLTGFLPRASESKPLWRAAAWAAVALAFALSVTYALHGVAAVPRVLLLVLGSAAGFALLGLALFRARAASKQAFELPQVVWLWLLLCAGYAVGVLLFGNVLANAVRPRLAGVWPWSGTTVVNRLANAITNPGLALAQSPWCQDGYGWGFRILTGHCGSLSMFARSYGLPIVVNMAVIAWWFKGARGEQGIPSRLLTTVFWAMELSLLAMPLGFVLFDFVAANGPELEWQRQLAIWLRSRVLEPWFYGGTLLALGLFLRECQRRQRRFAQSAMLVGVAVFALNPMVMPPQMVANFSYLFGVLRH